MDNVDDELDRQDEAQTQREDATYGHELRAVIDRGFAVQQFMNGELGQWLSAEATKQRAAQIETLVELDPDDPEQRTEIRKVRMLIGVLDLWPMFFNGFIQEGVNAQQKYQSLEHPD